MAGAGPISSMDLASRIHGEGAKKGNLNLP
jgi:hypothetical protein